MSKEVIVDARAKPDLVERLKAIPDPGVGKRLIVYIRASTVRLRMEDDPATIEEQERNAGGGAP